MSTHPELLVVGSNTVFSITRLVGMETMTAYHQSSLKSSILRSYQVSRKLGACHYAPSELFGYCLRELIVEFAARYPKLQFEFVSGAVKPHLLGDNIDVMVHIDEPPDSSYVARKITTAKTNYYASPDYLKRCGRPSSPREMAQHECIAEVNHEGIPRPWQFRDGDTITTLHMEYRYLSDAVGLCKSLAEDGQGIAMLPGFIALESVAKGKLVKLFAENCTVTHDVYAMYSSRHFVPAKISAFVSFLAENIPDKF